MVHMLADALDRPLSLTLTAGQVHDSQTAFALLDGPSAAGVIAGKANDNNTLRQALAKADMAAVSPSKRDRKVPMPHDTRAYKTRNRIERRFHRFRRLRHVATRYDRRAVQLLTFIHLASAMFWMPRMSIQPSAMLQSGSSRAPG